MSLVVSRKRFDQLGLRETEAWVDFFPTEALSARLFMHPEFCEAAHRVLGPVEVVVMEDHGRIVGVVPLTRATGLRGWLRGYMQVAQDVSDGFWFPVEAAYVDTVAPSLIKAGVWSGFFTHLPVEKVGPDVQTGAVSKTYVVRRRDGTRDLWDEVKERDRKFWNDTERCARRLNEISGGYQFHWRSPNLENDLDVLIRLKLEQYMRTHQYSAPLFRADYKAFLKAVALKDNDDFSAPLSVLYCKGVLVAAHLGLVGGGRLHYWFPVYDPSYAKYSPGKILLSEVMRHSGAKGVEVIDFGEGRADYKESVATETHDIAKAILARGILGEISLLPLRWEWRFAHKD